MAINKGKIYSSLYGLEDSIFARSRRCYADIISETRYIISILSPSLEVRRVECLLQDLEKQLGGSASTEALGGISESLRRVRLEVRGMCRRSASLVSNGWQSPVIESALDATTKNVSEVMIGRGTLDYHRAAHTAGSEYEICFRDNLVGQHKECRALATTCGMAAITTALQYAAHRIAEIEGHVVVDEGCYHETRFLVESLFRSRLIYLDLSSRAVVASLAEIKPSLIVFDSTRNSRNLVVLPVADIMAAVKRAGSYILIDSTSMVSPDALLSASKTQGVLERTLVATSLAKMHQFGMDIVTGGALIYDSQLDGTFPGPNTFRTHLGFNISEDSAVALPRPSLSFLSQRASLISHNVEVLSSALRAAVPDLSVETAQCWGGAALKAPYFNLSVSQGDEAAWYSAFMSRVMKAARTRGVPLVAGTSFGFDVTRIYLVESLIPSHRPFIRVSPGVESPYEATLVAEALVEAARGETV